MRSRPRWNVRPQDLEILLSQPSDRPDSGRRPPEEPPPPPRAARSHRTGEGHTQAEGEGGLGPAGQLALGAARSVSHRRDDRAAADHHLHHGLLHRRHSQAGRPPDQPGLDDPGQRRLRDRQNCSTRRQSGRRQPQPSAGARAPGRDRRRGPQLLFEPGLLVQRLRASGQQQPLRQRRPAGRVDDHAAVREKRAGRFRSTRVERPDAQGQGTGHRHQDVGGVVQRRCAAGLSEHHLLRPGRLRDFGGLQGVFRQAGRAAHGFRRGTAGGADSAPVHAGPGGRSQRRGGPVELGPRRHGGHQGAVAE